MSKNIAVIGNGGREHALCWKLAQSPHVGRIFALPGSYEIERSCDKVTNVTGFNLKRDFDEIAKWCKNEHIEMVVVGPEDPLAAGLADTLVLNGIRCFGPNKSAARIEADKSWAKKFMRKWNVPTARFESFTDATKAKEFIRSAPYDALVVKASGLAAGKGVIVAETQEEACEAVDQILNEKQFGKAGSTIVIEEKLSGEEVSLLAFVDQDTVKVMLPAQDHKRLGDNDLGPNTGGMGAYCPCPLIKKTDLQLAITQVLERTAAAFRSSKIKYCGVLYAGLMLTPDGPSVLEFNCRFGDPETQVILPLLETDLYEIMIACCENRLIEIDLKWKPNLSAVGVIMASAGYPETSTKGCEITGLIDQPSKNRLIFHSGTSFSNGKYFTNGGRVLINVSLASDLRTAALEATNGCDEIKFAGDGAQYRRDIAQKAFKYINLSYKDSGVDIDAGDYLVQRIKPLARGTSRPGVIGGLGGFGGLFRLNELTYKNRSNQTVPFVDPILVETTNGVGDKLRIAIQCNQYESIGMDLVAQCVNELLCVGAQPIAFLDYIACGKLMVPIVAQIIKGIADGCRAAGCALLGGETAEMPPIFSPGNYDLAGYSVGVLEHGHEIPRIKDIQDGDLIIGLPSTGLHCSGFHLIHQIMEQLHEDYSHTAPFSANSLSFAQELLAPTQIYVTEVLPLIYNGTVKAATFIGNGGILKNVLKIIPDSLAAHIEAKKWNIPQLFGWLLTKGLSAETILQTFNVGIGMILIVPKCDENWKRISGAMKIGNIVNRVENKDPVTVKLFAERLHEISEPFRDGQTITIREPSTSSLKQTFMDDANRMVESTFSSSEQVYEHNGKRLYRLFRNGQRTYNDPILVIGTDGIGSKILIAKLINKLDTIGVDLVAMCVNDILCNGAKPITFLDYYACSQINPGMSKEILTGVVDGVKQSNSALIDGRTFEVPLIYHEEREFDLAGFALGIVEYDSILPKMDEIQVDDIVIGLPSNGVHSNGFSLVHKLMKIGGYEFGERAVFSASGRTYGEELLVPTKIYVNALTELLQLKLIKAIAHITGGGLLENIPRVLPDHLAISLDFDRINIQPVFAWLSAAGNIDDHELQKTYNCGLGAVLVVSPSNQQKVIDLTLAHGGRLIGSVIDRPQPTDPRVKIDPEVFSSNLNRVQRMLNVPRKRIAVLISGNGSNLQSLIDATRNTTMGIGAEIVLVISNKENAFGLQRAQNAKIPTVCLQHKKYDNRDEFDAAMNEKLEAHDVDIICLAGFMRILSNAFVQKWHGKLLNIHPSLLPKYPGLNVQKKAIEAGDTESGCTVHFVDEGVDTGKIIFQQAVSIAAGETVESLTEKIHVAEHFAYPIALRMVTSGLVNNS